MVESHPEESAVIDELEKLASDDCVHRLLQHYFDAAAGDREAWSHRVTDWEGGSTPDLVRWHGTLLASNWLELCTGQLPTRYRLTGAGRAALNKVIG